MICERMERVKAKKIIMQVKKTWNPPRRVSGTPVDQSQTTAMITIAYVFGIEILGDLTPNQYAAVASGLKFFNDHL